MKTMKRYLPAFAAVASALSVFAEGGNSVTTAEGLMTSIGTTLEGYLTSAFPILASLIGAGIGIWAAIKLVGLVKRGFGSGTGR